MRTAELLKLIEDRGLRIEAKDGRPVLVGAKASAVVTPRLLKVLKFHRAAILEWLKLPAKQPEQEASNGQHHSQDRSGICDLSANAEQLHPVGSGAGVRAEDIPDSGLADSKAGLFGTEHQTSPGLPLGNEASAFELAPTARSETFGGVNRIVALNADGSVKRVLTEWETEQSNHVENVYWLQRTADLNPGEWVAHQWFHRCDRWGERWERYLGVIGPSDE